MTHEYDDDFETRIEQRLVESYGRERVVRQHVYPTGRRVDLLVDAGLVTLALELANDAEAVITAVSQAAMYAAHDALHRTVPMVVVPDGHAPEEPERDYLSATTPIVEESALTRRLQTHDPLPTSGDHDHADG